MRQFLPLALAAFVLASCNGGAAPNDVGGQTIVGSVSRLDCSRIDWFRVGLNDGAVGHEQPSRFNYLSNSCSGHGVRADVDGYFRGVEEGKKRVQ